MSSKYRTGRRDIWVLAISVGLVGISFGAAARTAGAPPLLVCASSILVFAGGSQWAALIAESTGAGWIAAALGGLALNARYFPLAVTLERQLGISRRRPLLGAHIVLDESASLAIASGGDDGRRIYWAAGLALFVCWNVGTAVGVAAGGLLGDPRSWGLDAVGPAAMLAILISVARDRTGAVSAVAGGAIALATFSFVPPGLPVLLAVAGSGVALVWSAGRQP